MGDAIYLAQCGQKHVSSKLLKGLERQRVSGTRAPASGGGARKGGIEHHISDGRSLSPKLAPEPGTGVRPFALDSAYRHAEMVGHFGH